MGNIIHRIYKKFIIRCSNVIMRKEMSDEMKRLNREMEKNPNFMKEYFNKKWEELIKRAQGGVF